MPDAALQLLPAVPESALPDGVLAQLPDRTSAPPWHCRVRAVLWLQRGVAPLPAGSPYERRALGLTVGAVVDYLDSPVGAYREVFAGPLLRGGLAWSWRPTVHVPFIAVDSLASVHGGRAHWALPKTLGSFAGEIGAGMTDVTGDGWSVQVSASAAGLPVPLVGPLVSAQAGRRAVVSLRGRGRLARVQVRAQGPTLTGWLGEGTHPGVVATGRMVVHPASPE